MRPHRPHHLVTLAFLLTMLLAACGGSGGGGGGDGGGGGEDFFTLGSFSKTEAPTAIAPSINDPQVRAAYFPADYLGGTHSEGVNITIHWDFDVGLMRFNNFISIDIIGTPSAGVTYSFPFSGASPADNKAAAAIVENSGAATCLFTGGDLTLTRYDAVGGKVEGSLDSITVESGCSPPTGPENGSFSANRDADLALP